VKQLITLFTEIKTELYKVTWPTRKKAIELTKVVIVVSLIVSVYLMSLDFGFSKLLAVFVR